MRSFTTKLTNPSRVIPILWQQSYRSFGSLATARIDDKTRQRFVDLVEGQSQDPYEHYLAVSEKFGRILEEILPKPTQEILHDFGQRGRSIILLQNCPVVGQRGLPPTPKTYHKPQNKDWVGEYFMLGLSRLINANPYLIEGVRDGTVINQIIPTDRTSKGGSGDLEPFVFHNEVVHEKRVPDFFLLLALRGHTLAKTTYCFLEDILHYLPPKIIAELEKPNFLMKSGDPKIFKDAKEHQCPILTKDELGNYKIRLNTATGRCEGLTEEAKQALAYINHCLEKNITMHGISLSHGDTLLVDNERTLHGRTSFDAKQGTADGKERWVLRMNLIENDLTKTR